jgi:hypothetical protein
MVAVACNVVDDEAGTVSRAPSEIKVIPFRGSLGLNTVDLAMAFLAELHGIR